MRGRRPARAAVVVARGERGGGRGTGREREGGRGRERERERGRERGG